MKNRLWVPSDKVRVGDRLLEYRGYARGPVSSDGIVKRIADQKLGMDDCFTGHDGTLWRYGARELEWLVERTVDVSSPSFEPISAPVKKTVNEYPDFCTRCGAPAYVGMFEITHRDEARAKDCPARRK